MQVMGKTTDGDTLDVLVGGLWEVADGLEAQEAGKVAALLVQAMGKTTDGKTLGSLAYGLSAVEGRLEAQEAGKVAALLVQAMGKTRDGKTLWKLANGLSAVAVRLETQEASRHCAAAAALLVQAMNKSEDAVQPGQTMRLYAGLTFQPSSLAAGLDAILTFLPKSEQTERIRILAGAVALGAAQPQFLLPSLGPALRPLPCPLTTQELVELLKNPFCVGQPRKMVLQQLANRYRRPFASVWEFLRFAREQHLDLDVTTPPQRTQTSLGR